MTAVRRAPGRSGGLAGGRPNLDCATVEVPVVHIDPDGPTLPLAVVRHRATDPAQRIGSLLTNPGGPGGPATDGIRMIGTSMDPGVYSPELLARYDPLAARVSMFTRTLWPVLSTGLVAAQNGDGTILLALSQALAREPDGTPAGFLEANVAVNCLDRDVPTDAAAHDRDAEEIAAAAPRFGRLSGLVLLPCANWPVDNPDRFTGPLTRAGAPPILVVGGRADAQMPYPWAEAMAASLESAVLLTREGVGHGPTARAARASTRPSTAT